MKKNSCILLTAVLLLSAFTLMRCSSIDNENDEIKLTVISSLERIGQNEPLFGEPQATIKAAKNEYESFQVVIGAQNKSVKVVNVEISDLSGESGTIGKDNVTLFRPDYVRVRRSTDRAELPPGLYTDPLVPFINPETGKPIEPHKHVREFWPGPMITKGHEMYALPFNVWEGQNQPIWVDVYVPKDAIAGEYSGTLTVTLDSFPNPWGTTIENVKNNIVSLPVNLTVWDFTLPNVPTHRNHFGGVGNIPARFNVEPGSDEYKEIEMRYCQMYSKHRLNPPFPRSLMPEMNDDGTLNIIPERHNALKKFIEDFNVADFEIPRAPIAGLTNPHKPVSASDREKSIKYYKDYYNYVKENGWDERAYVYLYDEPNTPECYQRVTELSEDVHKAAPQLKVLVVEQTYTQDPSWPDITSSVDIWCPLFGFIDRGSLNDALNRGDEVWSYTALSQRAPRYHPHYEDVKNYDSPYWHIDALLTSHRTPTWMNYQYGITGLLYWSLNTKVLDTWNVPAFSHFGSHSNGGGYFMYPGVPCGINGPVSSIRLKNLREAMEDYEYLHIYEKLAGRDAVLKIVSKIAPNWWTTSTNPKEILSARESIAQEIMKLKN